MSLKTSSRFIFLFISFISYLATGLGNPIPIKFQGNLVIIEATVNNRSGNFILDTGTANLVLNARYYDGNPSDHLFAGITGHMQAMQTLKSSVRIGHLSWKNIYSQVIPLNILEMKAGIPIHGLIGSSLFRKYQIHFNYQEGYILIRKAHRKSSTSIAREKQPREKIKIRYKGGMPSIPIVLNGKELRVILDTGAEVNLMDLKTSKFVINDITSSRYKNIGGLGNKIENRIIMPISRLQLGSITLKETEWTVIKSWNDLNVTLGGPNIQGVLGHTLFSQMEVLIDFYNKEILIWPYEKKEPLLQELPSRNIASE